MKEKTNKIYKTLEFNQILETLSNLAVAQKTKEKLAALEPTLKEAECKARMRETTEARKVLDTMGNPPLSNMNDLRETLDLAAAGAMLLPEQLTSVATFIYACKRMKRYLKQAETLDVNIAFYGTYFAELDEVYEEIDKSIRHDAVDDSASTTLRDIRRKIIKAEEAIKVKLDTILRSKKSWFSDAFVVMRNGRQVLPVKKEYKNQLPGVVIDASSSGNTYFIEPSSVRKLQDELSYLQLDEDNEIRKILYTLTVLVDDHMKELMTNMEFMENLDFMFAKAKFSSDMNAIPVVIGTERRIKIIQGRHPLLDPQVCVPLDFEIGNGVTGVVITGPNTGGKTVALKTVGLLSLMAQSGLHVPVKEGSIFSMHGNVLCDIGDGQSISENLSTFSAHITNIVAILDNVSDESLVLLDELGSGTDPAEGMGIAVAILDELRKRNCLFVATTHYPEIKDFAKNTPALVNARMDFDRDNLQPLYKLQIGEAGESCALYIAKRLGLPHHMLKRAHTEAYGKDAVLSLELDEVNQNSEVTYKHSAKKTSMIKKEEIYIPAATPGDNFEIGDSVNVGPENKVGIVYKKVNDKGDLTVQIKGVKETVNYKRLRLLASAADLYPPDYDFSIIFDTVENRKARHSMTKRHDSSIEIKYED